MNIENYQSKPFCRVMTAFEEMLVEDEIKCEIRLINGQENLFAIVSIILWPLEIKGFRIMKSRNFDEAGNNKLNLVPPSITGSDKSSYTQVYQIHNKQLWYKFQNKVLDHYFLKRKEQTNTGSNPTNNNENMSDEEIERLAKIIH